MHSQDQPKDFIIHKILFKIHVPQYSSLWKCWTMASALIWVSHNRESTFLGIVYCCYSKNKYLQSNSGFKKSHMHTAYIFWGRWTASHCYQKLFFLQAMSDTLSPWRKSLVQWLMKTMMCDNTRGEKDLCSRGSTIWTNQPKEMVNNLFRTICPNMILGPFTLAKTWVFLLHSLHCQKNP